MVALNSSIFSPGIPSSFCHNGFLALAMSMSKTWRREDTTLALQGGEEHGRKCGVELNNHHLGLTLCLWIDYCLGFHPLDPYTSKKSAVASIFSQPNITQRFSHSRRYNLCLHTSFVCAVDRLMSKRFDLTVCFLYLSGKNKDVQINIRFFQVFQ